jgi:glutaredoxin
MSQTPPSCPYCKETLEKIERVHCDNKTVDRWVCQRDNRSFEYDGVLYILIHIRGLNWQRLGRP